ncbi:DnaJ domain-containing protein [Babesia caballi]|uniref:DnaJ domain-containing protein n=1 Tax=Babesia caballi TaxID=5871 RepID=A0AAV4M4Z1_BABCB|nr:DnaJ domain-containing protein [Babesia caballi]
MDCQQGGRPAPQDGAAGVRGGDSGAVIGCRVKRWLRSMVRHIGNAKNSDVFLVSSTKGTGFEALERRLKEFLKVGDARNIYVVGAVNAGKSTFVNRFLSYISYGFGNNVTEATRCSDAGTLHIKRGIGGATRSAIPGTTLEFIEFGLFGGFKLIDTPGVPISSTMTQLLRRPLDILAMQMTKTLDPLVVRLDAGQSLLLGAVVRVDLIQGSAMNLQCFVGAGVTATVCRTVAAADVMKNRAGTRIFPPHSKDDFERLSTFAAHRLVGGRSVGPPGVG